MINAMSNFKQSHVYAYYVVSHHLIKVGYGDNPRSRMASYTASYSIKADAHSLRTWDFPAAGIASVIEGAIHEALINSNFERHVLSGGDQEAQELFALGEHTYQDALVIVIEAIEGAARAITEGLKSKEILVTSEMESQRRLEIRQEKTDEKHRRQEEKKKIQDDLVRRMTSRARANWGEEVQPWINCHLRSNILIKKKSGLIKFSSFLTGRDKVDELRKRDIYPEVLKMIVEMFHLTRRARVWRHKLISEFPDVRPDEIDLQFPGEIFLPEDSLHDHIDKESVVEVRIAIQQVTGWGGDESLELMNRDSNAFNSLIDFAKRVPSIERETGRTWCKYSPVGRYAKF